MSEPASSALGPYDTSEAALKELYLDREDDDDVVRRIVAKEEERSSDPGQRLAGDGGATPSSTPTIRPLRAEPRGPVDAPNRPAEKPKRRSKTVYAVFVAGALLLAFGWTFHRPVSTPSRIEAAKQPVIAGVLQVADLAAGRKINPGATYGFDLPAGKVRVAVVAGEVALTNKSGETLRACSSESFVIDAGPGPANLAHPLVSACGRQPSLLQAEIPAPPLPAPAPPAEISRSMLRAGGD